MLILNRSEVRSLASMPETIDLMKTAFRELSAGRAQSPLRTPIDIEEYGGVSLFMPASVPIADALGMKIVSVFPRNANLGLPTIHAMVALVDSRTGQPVAIMDGGYLTSLRTGAVSGAATDLMARPESKTLVVIGAGAQAETQVAAVAAVRPIERIIIVARTEDAWTRFLASFEHNWPDLSDRIETTTNASAVREADVICTATTSKSPVFDDADLPSGVHINAVGAFTPHMQEVPSATIARSRVVVDSFEAAWSEAGDLINPVAEGLVTKDHFRTELGNLVAGNAVGRTSADQITFFKSVGNAIQDVIVAKLIAERAREKRVGVDLDIFT